MINQKTRYLWAEKTFELTNIGAGALIFSQFLSEKGFSLKASIIGIILIIIGYLLSYFLLKSKRR